GTRLKLSARLVSGKRPISSANTDSEKPTLSRLALAALRSEARMPVTTMSLPSAGGVAAGWGGAGGGGGRGGAVGGGLRRVRLRGGGRGGRGRGGRGRACFRRRRRGGEAGREGAAG